ncbi:complement factor H-related protein 1-like [Epinephelus lanceolatus]
MCIRYLGFILLIWFPRALHAQSAAQSCSAPRLDGGFFAPKQQTYSDGTKLTYTCDEGHKPAVKGWWATSTCHNGKWSPEPQCIDEKACLPPDIPNAKYTGNRSGWYRDAHKIRITCDEGYEPKYRHVTAKCDGGTWTSLPVCEKSIYACDEPPKIPHAVIIHQEYQEVYPADTKLQYECKDGYTVEGADTTKSITCISGNWNEGPTCRPSTSGSLERNPKPLFTTVDHCGAYPNVPNGDVVERDQTFLKFQCSAFYTQVGLGTVVCYSDGTWSQLPICKEAFCVLDPAEHVGANFRLSGVEYLKEGEEKHIPCIQQDYSSRVQCTNGKINFTQCRETEPAAAKGGSATAGGNTTSAGSRTRPAGGGSSSTSGSNDRRPQFIPVDDCGASPNIPNGDVVQKDRMFLKYQCEAFHTLVGSDTVVCHSNRTWSPLPVCKETFCVLDPAQDPLPNVKLSRVEYLKEGERKHFPCVWRDYSRLAQCTNRRITTTGCCHTYDHQRGVCW